MPGGNRSSDLDLTRGYSRGHARENKWMGTEVNDRSCCSIYGQVTEISTPVECSTGSANIRTSNPTNKCVLCVCRQAHYQHL